MRPEKIRQWMEKDVLPRKQARFIQKYFRGSTIRFYIICNEIYGRCFCLEVVLELPANFPASGNGVGKACRL
jgi:hypothetical protein